MIKEENITDEVKQDSSSQEEADEQEAEEPEPEVEDPETEQDISHEELSHKELILMLEDSRSKADEHWNTYLRGQAELDNLQKRSARDLANAHKFAIEKFVMELLPVHDSMEMGVGAANEDNAEIGSLKEGVNLTLKMFSDVMEKFNIQAIEPEGEKFNPDLHQAMSMQEVEGVEPNTILSVIQKGYLLNDRLVRPAMVIVAK